jgi:hypothetical protein
MAYDRRILAASVVLQLVLGTLFAHAYDARVSMTTGYLVGTGHGPYSPLDLTAVFHHAGFGQLTTIGYPPPWPLVTGLIYRTTYALVPNLIVYDLALKLPLIAATIGLAYLVGATLRRLGAQAATCRRAWAFLLLNPLILFTGAAWGQIDVLVTLLAVAALVLVWRGRWASSAALMALAVCTKPTPLPILLVVLAWLAARAPREALRYAAVSAVWATVFVVLPVVVLGWRTAQIWRRPNAHFLMTGGMSYTTVARLFRDPISLPGHWWLVGLLWVVALAAGLVLLHRGHGFEDLVRGAVALALVVFLTRSWLAEPNVVLVLPLALMLASLGRLDRRLLTALWLIPLAFAIANLSPLQLLWLWFPAAWQAWLAAAADLSSVSLALRATLVVAWQVVGWWTVVACLRPRRDGTPLLGGTVGAPC